MAVINRSECLANGIRIEKFIQGIILVWVLIGIPQYVRSNPRDYCRQAKEDLEAVGWATAQVFSTPSKGERCGENSCCSRELEESLHFESKRRIDHFLKDSITKLSNLVDTRAKKFDGLFREMMNSSRFELHDMFRKTYGKIYLQNSDVFSDFFKELESYYKKGSKRLTDTLENFFGILYQRMFTVLNSQYNFDEKYLECVIEHMDDVKPFGDVPQKFTLQLRRSFVATRVYYKALATTAEVAKRTLDVKIDEECEKQLTNLQYCGSCKGLRGMGACSQYCEVVLSGCLRHYSALSSEWDSFVEALDKVADRLVGPYNIEMVVEPLNIKISEAIMNFQEAGTEVSQKIFSLCGKPLLSRQRRKVHFQENLTKDFEKKFDRSETGKGHGHKRKKTKKFEEEENNVPTLERLIKDIKMKVRETRQFWNQLPYQYCNNITAPISEDNCWNGSSPKPTPYSNSRTSPIVNEQIYTLKVLSDKLRKAYHGDEVEIIDDAEDNAEGSGSGSGDFEIDPSENESNQVDFNGVDYNTDHIETVVTSSTNRPEVTRTYSGSASSMSLSKALVQYLLPIVLVWFGGAISDLL